MAITIQTEPQDFSPVNNPCEFTFSSTNTGQDNFSFVVRLDIDGATHSFHEVFPESSNYGRFNASEILRSYVESKLITSGVLELDTSTYTVQYDIAVKEKYGTPPTEQGSFTDSSTFTGINGALRKVEWTNYDYTDYQIDTNTSGLTDRVYLSYFPYTTQNRFCGLTESQFLGLICTDTSADVIITLRDASGSNVATTSQALSVPSNDLFILDVSPQTIIDDTSITSTNFDNAYDYIVKVKATGGGSNTSTTIDSNVIIIDRECSLYDGKRLHWLNKFGVLESFSFRLYHEDNTSVSSTQYKRAFGDWNASNARVYNRYEGEMNNIAKRSIDTLILNSDWIHEEVQQWLSRSLYESPRVYLEVNQGVFEPVMVQKSSYKQKQRVKEGLIQENVTVKRTYEYISQLN